MENTIICVNKSSKDKEVVIMLASPESESATSFYAGEPGVNNI